MKIPFQKLFKTKPQTPFKAFDGYGHDIDVIAYDKRLGDFPVVAIITVPVCDKYGRLKFITDVWRYTADGKHESNDVTYLYFEELHYYDELLNLKDFKM